MCEALDRLERQVQRDVLLPLERAMESALGQAAFNRVRAETARDLRMALGQTGVVVGDLEALVGRLPPGVAEPWTRLETVDATHVRSLVKVAHEVSTSLARLLFADQEVGPSLIAIEFAFKDEVFAYDVNADGDGAEGQPVLSQAVLVPLPVAFTPRYGPALVIHEVSHGWVRRWLAAELEAGHDLPHREKYAELASRYFRRDATPVEIEAFADELFVETLIDDLALQMLGPSYLLAVAAWTLGRTVIVAGHGADHAAPLGTRLARLCRRARGQEPSVEILGMIGAIEEDLRAFRSTLDDRPMIAAYRDDVSALVAQPDWLPEFGARGVARLRVASLIEDLWTGAITSFEATPTVQALAHRPECRRVDGLRESNLWSKEIEEVSDPIFRILHVHARPQRMLELEELAGRVRSIVGAVESDVVRASMGSSDAIAILPHGLVRGADHIRADAELPAYLERRLAAEVAEDRGSGWVRSEVQPAETLLLLEVKLTSAKGEEESTRLLRRAIGLDVAGARLVRCFRGYGWAHVLLLFAVDTPFASVSVQHALTRSEGVAPFTHMVPHILLSASPSEQVGGPCVAVTTVIGAEMVQRVLTAQPGDGAAVLSDGGTAFIHRSVDSWRAAYKVARTSAAWLAGGATGRVTTRLVR